MIVAASTECFSHLSLQDAITKLVDLEFSSVEISVHEHGDHLKPSTVAADLDQAIDICLNTRRLDIVAYSVDSAAEGEEFFEQFDACCKLARATKVVTITVPSAEFGTPFNEEVERLRRLVYIAETHGVRVSIKSQTGRASEDPDTVGVLCNNVPGLGLTLDPSHYICGPHAGRNIDRLLKYVHHVQLRDTSKEELQVRIGQGEIEYGKLISQLRKEGYHRALTVDIKPMDDVDHMGELRKMRLLLESLLL
ncbi:MAG: sugar phosphate isomerase/epimerase [Planctomycetes bacterium]|nr:sugar phosphate isomerase/epimerase [Planctomycetota bacterium]